MFYKIAAATLPGINSCPTHGRLSAFLSMLRTSKQADINRSGQYRV
jgi:hypothetical protein